MERWSLAPRPRGNEWTIGARAGFGGPKVDVALAGGIRAYFGEDRFKTYLTAEVAVHIVPNVTAGPRLGFGIQYDFLPTVGVYLGGAAEVTAGQGIRIAGAVTAGLQFRTYIFGEHMTKFDDGAGRRVCASRYDIPTQPTPDLGRLPFTRERLKRSRRATRTAESTSRSHRRRPGQAPRAAGTIRHASA
jgi:hypothetical protein